MRGKAALSTLLFVPMLSGSMLIKSIDGQKAKLMPVDSAAASALLHPNRDKAADRLLPWAVVLRNDDDREVIGYNIIWVCTDPKGKVTEQQYTGFDFESFTPGSGIKAHTSYLISFVPGLGTSAVLNHPELDRFYRFYLSQGSTTASLEAVLYADGKAAGPYVSGCIPRWKAWIDAERDIVKLVASSDPSRDLTPLLTQMETKSLGEAHSSTERGSGESLTGYFARKADRSSSYESAYESATAHFASIILNIAGQKGMSGAHQLISALQSSKRYPVVHR